MRNNENFDIDQQEDVDVLDCVNESLTLIVWNDDINSFDWVIKALIDICGHDYVQAEQCAMIIHHQGKYAVKCGDYETLKPMCDGITDRGIGATIEEMVS
jgi:ATP-dependent Clp protease adaptor protein ClpS